MRFSFPNTTGACIPRPTKPTLQDLSKASKELFGTPKGYHRNGGEDDRAIGELKGCKDEIKMDISKNPVHAPGSDVVFEDVFTFKESNQIDKGRPHLLKSGMIKFDESSNPFFHQKHGYTLPSPCLFFLKTMTLVNDFQNIIAASKQSYNHPNPAEKDKTCVSSQINFDILIRRPNLTTYFLSWYRYLTCVQPEKTAAIYSWYLYKMSSIRS